MPQPLVAHADAPPPARRRFLGRLSAAVAAFAMTGAAAATGASAATPGPVAAAGGGDDDAEPWLKALGRKKHRQIFHSHDKTDGTALYQAEVWLDRYKSAYGLDGDRVAVVIAAHGVTGGALIGDEIWTKYELGKMYNIKNTKTKEPATLNPYLRARDGAFVTATSSVEALMARGVTFLLCDNALRQFAGYTAGKSGVTKEAAYGELKDSLIPGTVLVPTMLIAIGRAQEHGCSYLYSG